MTASSRPVLSADADRAAAVPAVRVRALRKSFGDFVALESVDLEVGKGEFFTLLGPSGSGKTVPGLGSWDG